MVVHSDDDPQLGQPLCADCYDYESAVVWQWWAPELFRRFTIALRRHLAHTLGVTPTRLSQVATVQYAKVAEYQTRGAVHFHGLVRLDGPQDAGGFAVAPSRVDSRWLAALVEESAGSVQYDAPPVHGDDHPRVLAFGAQVDTRPVRLSRRTDDPAHPLTAEQVAGYLAKYATKSAMEGGKRSNAHLRRLEATALELARRTRRRGSPGEAPYGLLRKWAHALAFRGHFSTKSRRYSVTLGQLRRARRRAQIRLAEANRTGTPIDLRQIEAELLAEDAAETTLVVGSWQYAGCGWSTEGETALATAAAARARERAQERAAAKHDQHERNRHEERSVR